MLQKGWNTGDIFFPFCRVFKKVNGLNVKLPQSLEDFMLWGSGHFIILVYKLNEAKYFAFCSRNSLNFISYATASFIVRHILALDFWGGAEIAYELTL